MSRKQEIYRELLRHALPHFRNTLSQFQRIRCFRVLTRKQQIFLRNTYEVAEFVHNLYVSVSEENFTFHDIWFLNYQARSFLECADERNCDSYRVFAHYVQELFRIVPDNLRADLQWEGPEGNYEWAIPKSDESLRSG